MQIRVLTRFVGTQANHNPHGTFGRMDEFVTVEEEWLDNRQNVSCIPVGTYLCRRSLYKGELETFEVHGVPGRSLIKIHPGNTEEDLRGCIALCTDLGVLVRQDEEGAGRIPKLAGLASRDAHKAFMAQMEGVEEFALWVRDYVAL